jgi:hypothetical protein
MEDVAPHCRLERVVADLNVQSNRPSAKQPRTVAG